MVADRRDLDEWMHRDQTAITGSETAAPLATGGSPTEPALQPKLRPSKFLKAGQFALRRSQHRTIGASWFVAGFCTLYAGLYVLTLFLEISYRFDEFGRPACFRAPLVFLWIFCASLLGLITDWRRTSAGKRGGFLFSTSSFVGAALLLCAALWEFLPGFPVTAYRAQAQTAQAAYAKNVLLYFLPLAAILGLVPFHFIAALRFEMRSGNPQSVRARLNGEGHGSVSQKAVYFRLHYLTAALFLTALFSIAMTNRLFDNLKQAPYMNLFMLLALGRVLVYFSLGILCLLWYGRALNAIQSECRARA